MFLPAQSRISFSLATLASLRVRDFAATNQNAVIRLGLVAGWGPKRVQLETMGTFGCAETILEMLEHNVRRVLVAAISQTPQADSTP